MKSEVRLLRYIDRVEGGKVKMPNDPKARALVAYLDDCRDRGQYIVSTDDMMAFLAVMEMRHA